MAHVDAAYRLRMEILVFPSAGNEIELKDFEFDSGSVSAKTVDAVLICASSDRQIATFKFVKHVHVRQKL
jgi:hypothetical protein